MDQFQPFCDTLNRRQFIKTASMGLGAVALSSMFSPSLLGSAPDYLTKPVAKRVIFLFMAGAPSQLDLFDYKPGLEKLHGKELPKSISKGQRVTSMTKGKDQNICASIFKFAPKGQSGLMMSELLPHLSNHVDEIAFIKSTYTEAINHDPAKTFFCTGSEMPGRASMGAWLSYGLGTLNKAIRSIVVGAMLVIELFESFRLDHGRMPPCILRPADGPGPAPGPDRPCGPACRRASRFSPG